MPKPKPKVIYFGNMLSISQFLKSCPEVDFCAWITEKEDLCDSLFSVSNQSELSAILKENSCDLGILGNFGLVLSAVDLKTAKIGFVNLHLGLLPENPGRFPIQKVLNDAESVTGVTLHWANEKPDAGPVIERRTTLMPKNRQTEKVFEKLEILALDILKDNLKELLK